MTPHRVDYSPQLKQLMQQVNLASYRALGERAGVSQWTINLIRQGQIHRLRLELLLALSRTLQIPLPDLIELFSPPQDNLLPGSSGNPEPNVNALRREYERLQQRLAQQEDDLRQQLQRDAIAMIESWLLQWPTAAHAVQQNGNLPASRLLPLTQPLQALLQSWNVVPIGTVGEEVAFDPQMHQPMGASPEPGQRVRIRYVGYLHGDRLLHRAKVSPVTPSA